MKTYIKYRVFGSAVLASSIVLLGGPLAETAFANGGPTPPDLTVCDGVDCQSLNEEICSDAGFKISLKSYTPASNQNSGTATYVYEVCSPPAGTCSNDASKSCLDNSQCDTNYRCQTGGPDAGTCSSDDTTACTTDEQCNPANTCSRECATDKFHELSHFDVTFPELGGVESCLSRRVRQGRRVVFRRCHERELRRKV
jgi:hypothetical protein